MKKSHVLLFTTLFILANSSFAHAAATITVGTSPFQFNHDLSVGVDSEDVKQLQIALNKDSDTEITKDGDGAKGKEISKFGMRTMKAVQAFQKKHKLNPSGFVGPLTRKLLNGTLGGAVSVNSSVKITTLTPTNAGTTAETLNGMVAGDSASATQSINPSFVYGTGKSDTDTLPYTAVVPNSANGSFSTTLSGLTPDTVYSYKACATIQGSQVCGKAYTFKTAPDTKGMCAIESFYADAAILHWSSTGCSNLTLSDGVSTNSVTATNSMNIAPSASGTKYILTGSGAQNTTAQSLMVSQPAVHTIEKTAPVISSLTATLGEKNAVTLRMAYTGGEEVPSVWFGYGATESSVTLTSSPSSGDQSGGYATIVMSNITPGTDYYFQSYVKNSVGKASSPIVKLSIPK